MSVEHLPSPEQKHSFRKHCDMLITSGLIEVKYAASLTAHAHYSRENRAYTLGISEDFKNMYGNSACLYQAVSVDIDGNVSRHVDADSVMDYVHGVRTSQDVKSHGAKMIRYARLGYALEDYYREEYENFEDFETIQRLDRVEGPEMQVCIDTMVELLKRDVTSAEGPV